MRSDESHVKHVSICRPTTETANTNLDILLCASVFKTGAGWRKVVLLAIAESEPCSAHLPRPDRIHTRVKSSRLAAAELAKCHNTHLERALHS